MTYQLAVICDHRRNAPNTVRPERIVSTIVDFPKPSDPPTVTRTGWLDWREVEVPGYPASLQTYFGEAARLGRVPRSIETDNSGEPTVDDFLALRELVPGMDHGQRWRFWCADCDDTVPARHERMVELLDVFRHAGVPSVTSAALAPRV